MSKKKNEKKDLDIITKLGIVTKVFNKQLEIKVDDEKINCIIPANYMVTKNAVGVGDFVEIVSNGGSQYKLKTVRNRNTEVFRGNRKVLGEKILIAANAEQMLVMVTADYLVNQTGYVEEAVIAALRARIPISLYISKWDMVSEQAHKLVLQKAEIYKKNIEHLFIGDIDILDQKLLSWLEGKTTLLVGDRACGKTTLLSRIGESEINITPGRVPSTNAVEMYYIGNMRVIDTPGFREFSLQKIDKEELAVVFPEIEEKKNNCGFRNCTHTHEENCSVMKAVKEKEIRRERLLTYQKMSGAIVASMPKIDYRHNACEESFVCKNCGKMIVPEGAGSQHRNHCPYCLCSVHVDNEPGDRASLCNGIMQPISVWVRNDGEWALIHRCKICGTLSSNRIAADDSPLLLLSIAVKPISRPPFPLDKLDINGVSDS